MHSVDEQDRQESVSLVPTSLRGMLISGIDAAAPLAGFLVGYEVWNVAVGAAIGIVVALALGLLRWRNGESLVVVSIATLVVIASAVIAALTGQGRGFFMLTAIGTTAGVVACLASLPLRRPATGVIARWLRLELPDWHRVSHRYRLHQRLTWGWLAYWALFAVAIDSAFALNDIAWLTVDDTVMKVSLLVMLGITIMLIRRTATAVEPGGATSDGADQWGSTP